MAFKYPNAALIVLGLLGAPASAQFDPQFKQSTINVDSKVVKPTRVISPWRNDQEVAGLRVIVKADAVTATDAATDKERWSVKTEDGQNLEWLAADKQIAYLKAFHPKAADKKPRPEPSPTVLRLDLEAGKWLDPLFLIMKGEKAPTGVEVRHILCDNSKLVALSMEKVTGNLEKESYRVSFFEGRKPIPIWSKVFESADERPYTGGLLWAARRPDYAVSSIQPLNWLGKRILVCAGPRQDLLCLDLAEGKEVWRLPRVWEFDRGFTGPSVWSNHLSRFGLDSSTERIANDPSTIVSHKDKTGKEAQKLAQEDAKAEIAAARKEHEESYDCSLVAGPVLVPMGKAGAGGDDYAVFVAVAKGPKRGGWAGYRSECVVYEIYERGGVLSRAIVPRMVNGWQFGTVENGLVWSCQQGAFLRLGLSGFLNLGSMGADSISKVEWFRQFRAERSDAWISSDPVGSSVAFTPTRAFTVVTGGYILKEDEAVYRFPITLVDLDTTRTRVLTLAIPFAGKVPLPKSNYRGDGKMTHAFGPYLLGITGLRAEGKTMQVILGLEGSAARVDFPLSELTSMHE